jgi:hypothetical protein
MRNILKEPLVHFVGLGLLLFAGHALWDAQVTRADYTITVDPAEIERQAAIFATENRRAPTDADLEGLLFAHVEEKILVREAQRLGLDADDTIIRRRLAQKMRFMIEDGAAPALPDAGELENWYNTNTALFLRPQTRSFEHIYLSPKDRSDTVEAEAKALLDADIADWESQGDAFMSGRNFTAQTPDDVRRDFGTQFSQSLFDQPVNVWTGPINSAFGVHLVRITETADGVVPDFADIRPEVEAKWRARAVEQENTEQLRQLIEKYKVDVRD